MIGRFFLFAFCFMFGSVGIGMSGMSAFGIYRWWDTRSWNEVPASIKTLELERRRGEGTTYKVACTYSYQVDGQAFDGSQPSLYFGSDNLGSFQKDLHTRLQQAHSRDTVVAFVDTNNPSRSVLDRTYRPGFYCFSELFALAFGSIGIAIWVYSSATQKPFVRRDFLHVQSAHHSTRAIMKWLGAFWILHLIMTVTAAAISMSQQQLAGWLIVLFVGLIGLGIFTIGRRLRAQPVAGRLLIPRTESKESARIELPASWQGPVEMEVRWNLPLPPSNRIGVEDDSFDADLLEMPMVGGTTAVTHVPIELPAIPEALKTLGSSAASDQSVKLEVAGRIGGYKYQDAFEFPLTELPGMLVK